MNYVEPPCRICGSSRDAHRYNHDHRYKSERYCVCGKPATWYVDGDTLCSAHKGIVLRGLDQWEREHNHRIEKIDRSR